MSVYADLQRASATVDKIKHDINSVLTNAHFLKSKREDPDTYPGRSIEQLTVQLLEAIERLATTQKDYKL